MCIRDRAIAMYHTETLTYAICFWIDVPAGCKSGTQGARRAGKDREGRRARSRKGDEETRTARREAATSDVQFDDYHAYDAPDEPNEPRRNERDIDGFY